jgi:transcription initiation factor TFIIIB Brf1 subunit/transcription initiation factor TFIIB
MWVCPECGSKRQPYIEAVRDREDGPVQCIVNKCLDCGMVEVEPYIDDPQFE